MRRIGRPTADDRKSRERSRIVAVVSCQTGLLILGVVLTGIARESTIAPNFHRVLPIVHSVLLFWCFTQLATIAPVFRSDFAARYVRLRTSIDLTFSLAIIWLTGGVVSFFLPLLFAGLLVTSTLLGLRRALSIASMATIALTAMTTSQLLGWRPAEWTGAVQRGVEGRHTFLISTLIGQGIALHLIAYLGARLTSRLERAEKLNTRIVECIGDGVIAINARGSVVLANSGAIELFGGQVEDLSNGRRPTEIWRRRSDDALIALLETPSEGVHSLTTCEDDATNVRHVTVESRFVGSERARDADWIHIFRDRTYEERAVRAELRLRHLQALEDLSVGLVHEIRNPLAAVHGGVQELASDRLSGDQRQRVAEIVGRESERLGRIVDEFLEASSSSPTRVEEFDLRGVLREVVESLTRRIGDGEVIQFDAPKAVSVEGHREQIYRAFANLGSNAIDSMKGRAGAVRVSLDSDGLRARVVISDEGCGMDTETRERIFNPFFTTKPREGGLGLPFVQRVVEGHGGEVQVETKPDVGTRFTVHLPCRQVLDADSAEAKPSNADKHALAAR